jgi:sterol desaturase/sphingolipid hydroxylase (fatty acid hydroxylase superfamily)
MIEVKVMLSEYYSYITKIIDFDMALPRLSPAIVLALALLLAYGLFISIEKTMPKNHIANKHLRQSYLANMGLFLVNNILISLLPITALLVLAKHYAGTGLLGNLSSPLLKGIISLLALDFVLYIWHRVCHSFDSLWMFHKVHHSDPWLNVSTAFRIHILEMVLTNLAKGACIVLLGIEESMVLTSEAITTLFIMFHHTNFTFWGEKILGKLIIVPALHRTHHSVLRHEHDSNYGAVLAVWDSLLGSRLEVEPAQVGIKAELPMDVMGLVMAGFSMASPGSVKPAALEQKITELPLDGVATGFSLETLEPVKPSVLEHMIAEAAYYKAEKRGFCPGNDIADWLEAKREIMAAVYGNKKAANNFGGQLQLLRPF